MSLDNLHEIQGQCYSEFVVNLKIVIVEFSALKKCKGPTYQSETSFRSDVYTAWNVDPKLQRELL